MRQKDKVHRKILRIKRFLKFKHRTETVAKIGVYVITIISLLLTIWFVLDRTFILLLIPIFLFIGVKKMFVGHLKRKIRDRYQKTSKTVSYFNCENIIDYLRTAKNKYHTYTLKKLRLKSNQNSEMYCDVLEYRDMKNY